MKTYRNVAGIVVLGFLLSAFPGLSQDAIQFKHLAKRLVQSANVKKGDVVIISGGKHLIPLMENVAIEVQIAGGFANMWLASDRVQRAIYMDEPEEFLGQKNDFWLAWYRRADVIISLPSFEDGVKLVQGVSPARMAKAAGAAVDRTKELNELPIRMVGFNLPTPADARLLGVDYAAMRRMTLEGIGTDYSAVTKKAAQLKSILQAGKQVHVTTSTGTDFEFSLVPGRMVLVDDGFITPDDMRSAMLLDRSLTLPSGVISLAPLETSANGSVAVAKDYGRYGMIKNTKFQFKNGKVEKYTAATNAKTFIEEISPYSGPTDVIGSFSIGLNPAMRPMDRGTENWFPGQAEGLVYVGVGDNKLLGGNNLTSGSGWGWAIPNATVTVDGKVIIKNGKLL
jgi:leucyl aminopeptidase (aminopeptidase T)